MSQKVILTCAVVGENQYNSAHPNFSITPQQIADAALEAEQAGASVVHLHVRNPETGAGSRDPDLFLDMATRVREIEQNAMHYQIQAKVYRSDRVARLNTTTENAVVESPSEER